jgi:hypothetical protein
MVSSFVGSNGVSSSIWNLGLGELPVAKILTARRVICLPFHKVAAQPPPAVYFGLDRAPEAEEWIDKLQGTDVVGAPGEFKPLILDQQGRLHVRRYWEYEKKLADSIKSRVSAARPGVGPECEGHPQLRA